MSGSPGAPVGPSGVRARWASGAASTAALLAAALLVLPPPASAQGLPGAEGVSLEVGGYLRTLSGVSHTPFELPGLEPTTAFNAEVLRLELDLRLGDRFVVTVHDKVQLQVNSSTLAGSGTLAGFGVTAQPGRAWDLRRDFIDRERIQAWNDVDRLAVTAYTGMGDVTVGRQAVTWGISALFPVADLWAQFSPFELDTSEKPGVDAVRWLAYPGGGWEVDAVLAARGRARDLSVGVRGGVSLAWADLWAGGGKFWRQAMAMGGISAPVGSWKLRGEAVIPWDLDEDGWERPRVTVGVDWLGGEVNVTGEYHHNGVGVPDADRYLEALADPRFQRGESYYLGRHYLGGVLTWIPGNDRLSLSLSGIVNLQDPSTAWTPVLTYDLGQSARVSAGGVLTTGTPPSLEPSPTLESEYGTYGDLVFTRISLYF